MSSDELHYGRLIPLEGDVEELAKNICLNNGIYMPKDDYESGKTWFQLMKELLYGSEYIISNNRIYKIEDNEQIDDPYIERMTKGADGNYYYVVSFYNGGTYLEECLNDLIKKLE